MFTLVWLRLLPNMQLVVIVGRKLKFLHTQNLPSSFIWPLYEQGKEKSFCLQYVNLTKYLKQEILRLQKLVSGQHLSLLENYEIYCNDIIFRLNEIRNKKVIKKRHKDICFAVNKYTIVSFLFEKVLKAMSTNDAVLRKLCAGSTEVGTA